MPAQIAAWQNFFVLIGGAAAALTGLIFVGLTLYAKAILKYPLSHHRALSSIQWLMAVVFLSAAVLVPGQPPLVLGIEVELVGMYFLLRAIGRVRLQRLVGSEARPRPRLEVVTEWMAYLVCLAAFFAAGAALMIGMPAGFYLLAIAMACVLAFNVWNAWVLIAEMTGEHTRRDGGQLASW
jgi:modulator of FtsH protease